MKAIYFSVGKQGYTRHSHPGDIPTESLQKLPVYRVVNEFMNLDPTDHQTEINQIIQQTHKEEEHIEDCQKTTRSFDTSLQKKNKCVSLNPLLMMDREEVSSIYFNESPHNFEKDTLSQSKKIATSRTDTVTKGKTLTASLMDNKTQKQDFELDSSRCGLYFQLQKQKELRRNLQNSYKTLLMQLQSRHNACQDLSQCSDDGDGLQQGGEKIDNTKCGNGEDCIQMTEDKNDTNLQRKWLQQQYLLHFQQQKYFESRLAEKLNQTNHKIIKINKSIIKQQHFIGRHIIEKQLLQKQAQVLKLNIQNKQLKQCLFTNNQQMKQRNRHKKDYGQYLFMASALLIAVMLIINKLM